MSFANHNILDIALSIIPPTVVQVRKNLDTKVNKYGQSEASYTEWIEVYGIVEPGPEQNEHTERIDFSKKRVIIWLRGYSLDGTHLQWAPDQIRYTDRIFNVVSVEDWFPYDNYRKCECVEALNLGENQRGAKTQPSVSSIRRKVMAKASAKAEAAKPDPVHDTPSQASSTPPEDTPSPVPYNPPKNNSLVGKARIRI